MKSIRIAQVIIIDNFEFCNNFVHCSLSKSNPNVLPYRSFPFSHWQQNGVRVKMDHELPDASYKLLHIDALNSTNWELGSPVGLMNRPFLIVQSPLFV